MALGSAIGTGLFYGSASAIQMAGPAVLLAYLIGGAAVFMVMRALGEMAVHNPVSGSFGQYASTYLGPMAGFILGWTYAFEMIIVCLADVTAFGIYMGFWFPEVARWVWVLGIVFLIGGLNLCNVKVFGEMEFWLSLLKVGAIVAMILGGFGIMLFGIHTAGESQASGLSNLWAHGGFMPNGIGGLIASFAVVMFAFGGIEIIGITAGEAKDPQRVIPKAINAVPLRILLFYVLTLRAWERRYGLIVPHRTAKGHRLFSTEHIQRIQQILLWLNRGVSVSQIKPLLNAPAALAPAPDSDWQAWRQTMIEAISELAERRLDDCFNQAMSLYPARPLCEQLLQPLLNELEQRWQGQFGAQLERVFFHSWLRSKLGARATASGRGSADGQRPLYRRVSGRGDCRRARFRQRVAAGCPARGLNGTGVS